MSKTYYLTSRRRQEVLTHVMTAGDSDTINFDLGPWEQDNGAVTSVNWTVNNGDATLANLTLASSVASGVVSAATVGESRINIVFSDGTDTTVRVLQVNALESGVLGGTPATLPLDDHIADTANPHQVTATQLGLEDAITKVGTPATEQVAVFTGDGTAQGAATLKYSTSFGLQVTKDIRLLEQADHSHTPVAGAGYIWVKNTAPSTLIFTDDTGVDITVGTGGGGSDPVAATHTVTLTAQTSGTITLNSSFDTLASRTDGDVVHLTGRIKFSSISTPVGEIRMGPVPTCADISEGGGVAMIYIEGTEMNPLLTDEVDLIGIIEEGNTYISIYDKVDGGRVFPDDLFSNGTEFVISGTYFTSD